MLSSSVPDLFARQGAAAHRDQLLALGATRHQIDGRVARGVWEERQPRVYVPAGTPDTLATRCWCAYLAVLHAGVASESSQRRAAVVGAAAGALTLPGWPEPDVIEIGTQFRARALDLDRAVHHRLRTWGAREFVVIDGLVVASPTDTIVDLASRLSEPKLLGLVQETVFRKATTTTALRRRCGRGVTGSTAVRAACLDIDTGIESISVKVGVRALRNAGFVVETGVQLAPGIGETDFVIRGRDRTRRYGLAGEIDGPHHEEPAQRERDERKDVEVELTGYTPARFDAEKVLRSPAWLVRKVEARVREIEAAQPADPNRVRRSG